VSLRSELRKEFKKYKFREYMCSGKSCTFETVGIAGLHITCPTSGCRGNTTARGKVSSLEMLEAEIEAITKARGA